MNENWFRITETSIFILWRKSTWTTNITQKCFVSQTVKRLKCCGVSNDEIWMKKSKHSKCVTMFRKLKNYKFLNSFGRSSQVNLEVFSRSIRWKSSESCNENDVPVVGSNLRYEKRPSNDCSAYRCTNVPGDWNQPYLTNQSRSHTVEGAVGAILSSPNADNEIEKLPPIRDMPCDDLIEMLIKFDDAGLPTHCRIMNTLLEEITDQAKNSKQPRTKENMICQMKDLKFSRSASSVSSCHGQFDNIRE